ncbi:MAG TPA: hypothetical protein VIU85_04950 [Chthoniobacterales bacterium]
MKPLIRNLFVVAALGGAMVFMQSTAHGAGSQNVWEALQQPPANPCSWGGFYIGFNVGGAFNHFDLGKQHTDVNLAQQFYEMIEGDEDSGGGGEGTSENAFTTFQIPGHTEDNNQTIGGGQTGFKMQFGHIVFGVEGDFQGNGATAHSDHNAFQENELFLITRQQFVTAETQFRNDRSVETTWNGHIGGNIGWCWNRFLIYVAGGASFTDAQFTSMDKADTSFFGIGESSTTIPTTSKVTRLRAPASPEQGFFIGEIVSKNQHTHNDVLTGYYAGGGTLYQLTDLVSAGFEYRHVGYSDEDEHFFGGNGPVFSGNGHLDLSSDQILFKVNIIIGSWGH